MKTIQDFSRVKISSLTGALRHHVFFTENSELVREIKNAAEFIKKSGLAAYVKNEYPDARYNSKNIILNNISGKLYVTDGNRHCVSIVMAEPDVTIGKLLKIEPGLFRYWEAGYEEGGDTAYQPYDTYCPINVDVSRINGARRGTDDKNQRINIISSDIPYDSELFGELDRGRPIGETARVVASL